MSELFILCPFILFDIHAMHMNLSFNNNKKQAIKNLPTCMLSCFGRVWLFATLWTVACQAPLFMGFSRQEYWSGLPCPTPGDLLDPGIEPESLISPSLPGDSLPLAPPGKPPKPSYPRKFPGGPVFRTLCLHYRTVGGTGLIPGQGTKIPHAVWFSQERKKQRKKEKTSCPQHMKIKWNISYRWMWKRPENKRNPWRNWILKTLGYTNP